MTQELKMPRYTKPVLSRLEGGATLVRENSQDVRAVEKGGGYVYFTLPDCRTVPVIVGRFLVENGLVSPLGDDLFGGSQTYQVAHD
ncbi:hypothetical protein ACI0FM_14755 [Paenochrobactrum sp. BZR 588]|uniref:hypothetical protein n=2 Tax=Brucellaceae TaxID=118882 RepID=UPI00385408B2